MIYVTYQVMTKQKKKMLMIQSELIGYLVSQEELGVTQEKLIIGQGEQESLEQD